MFILRPSKKGSTLQLIVFFCFGKSRTERMLIWRLLQFLQFNFQQVIPVLPFIGILLLYFFLFLPWKLFVKRKTELQKNSWTSRNCQGVNWNLSSSSYLEFTLLLRPFVEEGKHELVWTNSCISSFLRTFGCCWNPLRSLAPLFVITPLPPPIPRGPFIPLRYNNFFLSPFFGAMRSAEYFCWGKVFYWWRKVIT